MEDLERQRNGCKYDLGTRKPLDNFGHKGNKIWLWVGGGTKKQAFFWSQDSMTVIVILTNMIFSSIQY